MISHKKMRIHMLFLFQVLLCSTAAVSAATSNVETDLDRQALMDFKNRITKDPFEVMQLWNASTRHCDWKGITCNPKDQRVSVINLRDQQLSGTLPPSIGNLSFLTWIDIQDNIISGGIPQEVGRLVHLRHINMNWNQISGGIPTNLSHCRSLELFDVTYNSLSGQIPDELSSLSNLKFLGMGGNNLTGKIPTWIGNLSSLVAVSLALNSFTGNIPNEFSQLSKLGLLQLYGNKLSGVVPPSVYNISTIYFFSVTQNQLHGEIPADVGMKFPNLQTFAGAVNSFTGSIPVSLTNCTDLRVLDFAQNGLTGSVPANFGTSKKLRWLNFDDNRLGGGNHEDIGFVSSLVNCTVLQKLGFSRNKLGGEFPAIITNLSTQLTYLGFGDNLLHGSISFGIKNLASLARLALEGNSLTGRIPLSLGELRNLTELKLQKNNLSGPIPSTIGNLTSLTRLFLEDNKLEGKIPVPLGSCQKLLVLNLSNNNFEGTIPKEVIGISSLSIALSMSSNALSGEIPVEVNNLRNLLELDLANNRLSGELPSALGGCVTLQRLLLQGNSFQGMIPKTLDNLNSLTKVDLSRNNLSGKIPEFFSSLKSLNLSYNDFDGKVQQEGVFANASAFSVLGNNMLCGGIPQLLLPPCLKPRKSLAARVVIIISVTASLAAVLICATAACCFIKRKKRPPEVLSSTDLRQGISYLELAKATNGFSEGNLLGSGSFGSVYKGLLPNIIVAVKVLNLEQKGASNSFTKECMALKNIRHRNLLKIITLCSSVDQAGNDFKGLVFEFMSNGNLDHWLHPGSDLYGHTRSLSLMQRLDVAIDVASALKYLHFDCKPPIAHCDLKPSNILIDDKMTAHVGDFGLAHLLLEATDESRAATLTAGLKGSIGYIPPEYGMGGEASTLGDVYSYGIFLLEMFTGKRPTDDRFKDGLSIHEFVATALPHHVMNIIDSSLNLDDEEQMNHAQGNDRDGYHHRTEERAIIPKASSSTSRTSGTSQRLKLEEFLLAVFTIGLSCSEQLPRDRMVMYDVELKMRSIKKAFSGARI